jgi:lipopolysaccharide/colanic/teichoic acid biosynthesis glycosyltransferase
MIWTKRPFDFFCATVLTLLVSPILAYFAWKVWRQGDGPIFYLAERMKTPAKSFKLIKFRTMREEKTQDRGVTGSDKNDRITPLGRYLRARHSRRGHHRVEYCGAVS